MNSFTTRVLQKTHGKFILTDEVIIYIYFTTLMYKWTKIEFIYQSHFYVYVCRFLPPERRLFVDASLSCFDIYYI